MSTITHKYPDPKEGSPLLTDEQMKETAKEIFAMPKGLDPNDEEEGDIMESIIGDRLLVVRGMREARIIYESHLATKQAEIDGLRERLSLYEQQVVEPFNGHTPGYIKEGARGPNNMPVIGTPRGLMLAHVTIGEGHPSGENAAFMVHCWNSHYPLLRRTAVLEKALQSVSNPHGGEFNNYRVLGLCVAVLRTERHMTLAAELDAIREGQYDAAALSTIKQLSNGKEQ